jgi:hypothetical protein
MTVARGQTAALHLWRAAPMRSWRAASIGTCIAAPAARTVQEILHSVFATNGAETFDCGFLNARQTS